MNDHGESGSSAQEAFVFTFYCFTYIRSVLRNRDGPRWIIRGRCDASQPVIHLVVAASFVTPLKVYDLSGCDRVE